MPPPPSKKLLEQQPSLMDTNWKKIFRFHYARKLQIVHNSRMQIRQNLTHIIHTLTVHNTQRHLI